MKNPYNPVIFIIDGNASYRQIIKGCLLALSYNNVVTFSKCEEITATNLSPDIVIMDHEFGPECKKGFYFFKEFRSVHPLTVFIFFSSVASIDLAVDSIKSGALDFIVKSRTGLEKLIKRLSLLINSHISIRKKRKAFNAALTSLCIVSMVLIIAVMLYN